ncbi:MAG: hypothetical protein AAF242_11490 [Bacteroidota bacterium]
MKALLLFALICFGPRTSSPDKVDYQPVKRYTVDGQLLEVDVLIRGKLSYFKRAGGNVAVPFQESYPDWSTATDAYYVAQGQEGKLHRIHAGNYQKVLRPMLATKPKLARKLGKKGYNYRALYFIIQDYNQQ